jgi:hypothetical protein
MYNIYNEPEKLVAESIDTIHFRQKLNATTNAFGAPDALRTCHFATTIVNSVLAS